MNLNGLKIDAAAAALIVIAVFVVWAKFSGWG